MQAVRLRARPTGMVDFIFLSIQYLEHHFLIVLGSSGGWGVTGTARSHYQPKDSAKNNTYKHMLSRKRLVFTLLRRMYSTTIHGTLPRTFW